MYSIYCLNNISSVGLQAFTDNYRVTEDINEADAIIVRSANMHEMNLPKNIKCVARAGAGVNNIPLEEYARAGIPVFNTPGANANSVKELVLCGMLLASRDIIGGVNWVRQNSKDDNIAKSAEKAKKAFAGKDITGKNMGVIGLGAIGRLVASAANALGMNVCGYDPFLDEQQIETINSSIKIVSTMQELMSSSDYVSIHIPVTAKTKGIINASMLNMMPSGSVFLNFSRDSLVNSEDMQQALASGHIAKYVCDFATPEFVDVPNTIIFPHLGASTVEAEDNCARMAAEEIMAYLERGEKINCVN